MKKVLILSLMALLAFPAMSVAMEEDKDEIYKVISSHYKNVNEGKADAIAGLLTEDVIFMPPFSPEITGKENVRPFSEETHGEVDFDFNYKVDEIIINGDLAFVRSTVQGFLTPKKMNVAVLDQIKAIHILQKQETGGWKIARFMFNSNVPLQ